VSQGGGVIAIGDPRAAVAVRLGWKSGSGVFDVAATAFPPDSAALDVAVAGREVRVAAGVLVTSVPLDCSVPHAVTTTMATTRANMRNIAASVHIAR
jgi:hypothetical protein